MTDLEMSEEIFLALTDFKNGGPIETDVGKARDLASALLHALNGRGLLKLDAVAVVD